MKRCKICGWPVWFWQKSFGGRGEVHKRCDYKEYCSWLDDLVAKGQFDSIHASLQKTYRLLNSYF